MPLPLVLTGQLPAGIREPLSLGEERVSDPADPEGFRWTVDFPRGICSACESRLAPGNPRPRHPKL